MISPCLTSIIITVCASEICFALSRFLIKRIRNHKLKDKADDKTI